VLWNRRNWGGLDIWIVTWLLDDFWRSVNLVKGWGGRRLQEPKCSRIDGWSGGVERYEPKLLRRPSGGAVPCYVAV